MIRNTRLACLSAAAVLFACGSAGAQSYRLIEIPLLPGTTKAAALGVNSAGDAVGWCFSAPSTYRAFFYDRSAGTTTEIAVLGRGTSQVEIGAHSINDNGEVAGVSSADGLARAFYWSQDTGFKSIHFTPTSQPPHQSGALAISANGLIGGINSFPCVASPSASIIAAAAWENTDEPPNPVIGTPFPCGRAGVIHGINAGGALSGETLTSVNGVNWKRPIVVNGAGELATFSGPAENGVAYDVNDAGWACGFSENRSTTPISSSACVWSPSGNITDLNASAISAALSINQSQNVVGWATFSGSGKTAAIWPSANPGALNLNSLLVNPLPGGSLVSTAECISDTGFIAGRSNEQVATGRAILLEPCTPTIVSAPLPQNPAIGGTATFSVDAAGAGTLSFQWRRNQQPLSDGPTGNGSTVSGSDTASLTISGVVQPDAGVYDVVITSACGGATSPSADLTTPLLCPADLNGDGAVNTADLTQLLLRFGQNVAPGTNGDITGNGVVNTEDLINLLAQFGRICD